MKFNRRRSRLATATRIALWLFQAKPSTILIKFGIQSIRKSHHRKLIDKVQ